MPSLPAIRFAIPRAIHRHDKAAHHFAITVRKDAPAIDHAIEIILQIKERFFVGVISNLRARAAACDAERGRSACGSEQAAT
jgi:hypothetical protein